MTLRLWMILAVALWAGSSLHAQKIVYSDYDRDENRRMKFEVVGKVGGHYQVYKNSRNKNWIVLYNDEMQEVAKEEQTYIPNNERLINTDVFAYQDFSYLIFQYQKKNAVYCMAAKIDGNGKLQGEVQQLDTSHIGFSASNRIYSVVASEDKSKLAVFKINSKNRKLYVMTTMLFDDRLNLQKKSRLEVPMEERNDNLGDFTLDNEGNLVFCKFYRNNNDIISKAWMMIKPAGVDSIRSQALAIEKTLLDEIHVKTDNVNKRYLLTSFYYKEKKGNIDGFYFFIWDAARNKESLQTVFPFTDDHRREARGEASMKMAFNDFFIRHIIMRKDGGFIVSSESYYTTSRNSTWNRWNYLYGSPFYSPLYNDVYYSPYYNNAYWNSRYGNSQSVRYHADNLAVFSFSSTGSAEWNSVIGKSQFSDESDDVISFQLMNTGGSLHFLFNQQERRNNLLTDVSLSPAGDLSRNPTLKNLDRGHEFMPKYAKQVSSKKMIIPCLYRNFICFAKIDYSQK